MDEVVLRRLLEDQIRLMDAAAEVLRESHERVSALLRGKDSSTKRELTIGEKESCEALTSRFARLCDFLSSNESSEASTPSNFRMKAPESTGSIAWKSAESFR